MKIFENLKMAVGSIISNKMRSFLTMLGIIIGISSVIAIVSLGAGGQSSITSEFEKIGASSITVSVDASSASRSDYITLKDVEAINEKVNNIKYISPTLTQRGKAITDKTTLNATINAGNEFYDEINNIEIVYGRFFNNNDVNSAKYGAVVDETTAIEMFGYEDVVGQSFKIGIEGNEKKFTIIGVKKASSNMGPPRDVTAEVYVPITTFEYLYPDNNDIGSLKFVATTQEEAEEVGNATVSILEARHNNRGKDLYSTMSIGDILEQINSVLGIFTTFISAVAGISLVVGGIGVMNIMLVSVTERTREIGIRKAIGATTTNIMVQFLTESAIISLIGGIIGMLLGIIGAEIAGGFMGVDPEVSITVVLGTILFSSAIGIFFGIYPARKAARLKPIDALRYE